MTDRRSFLGTLGAAALAAMTPIELLARPYRPARPDRLDKIGVQLYSVRAALEKDFDGTLARVAKIGYQEVEFAGYFKHTGKEVRAALDRHGLTAPSAHIAIEDIRSRWPQVIADAKTVGHEYLVCAWINDEDRTVEGYKRVAGEFNRAAETAKQAGIRFGYHNHLYEFAPVSGQRPYDILLANTDPKLVYFEMDLFWITKGGGDPLAYFAKYPGRFPLVHVKDMAADRSMVDVGRGTIDFKTIFQHRKQAGIEHYFMEYDDPPDPFASLSASYKYLRGLRF